MGLRRFLRCPRRAARIKIMTVDGRCMKLDAPLYVKEALAHYPDHAIFHSDTIHRLGNRASPLQRTVALQPGQLYFLIPIPKRRSSRQNYDASADSPAAERLEPEKPQLGGTRRVSFATTPVAMDPSESPKPVAIPKESLNIPLKNTFELLPSSQDGVVRLKVLLSKTQLAQILNKGGDAVSLVESVVSPLLKDASMRRSNLSSNARETSCESSFTWRPSLDSIPETNVTA